MQAVAREMHLRRRFVLPGDGDADATVRIFTPTAELPFAGHPVLGAAFVVGDDRTPREGHVCERAQASCRSAHA